MANTVNSSMNMNRRNPPWKRIQPKRSSMMHALACLLVLGSLSLVLSLKQATNGGASVLNPNTNQRVSSAWNDDNRRSLWYGSSYYYHESMKAKGAKGSKISKSLGYYPYGRHRPHAYKSSKSSKTNKVELHNARYYHHFRHKPFEVPYHGSTHHASPALAPTVSHHKPGYGHAPTENGGLAAPSYFKDITGVHAPSGGDPDPWGGGRVPSSYVHGYAPSEKGGYAPPSYFVGTGGYGAPSYGDVDPWSGGGYEPSSYWNSPSSYGGAPQAFGYDGGHVNHRPKPGQSYRTPPQPAQPKPQPVEPPVQTPAPVEFRNPDFPVPTVVMAPPIDFRIPGAPAIAPSSPFASPFAPSAPSATETTAPVDEPTSAPVTTPVAEPTSAPIATPAPVEEPTSAPVEEPTSAPVTSPAPTVGGAMIVTSEDMPTFNSADMPSSGDMPTIMTGPDAGQTPVSRPTPSPVQDPTESPAPFTATPSPVQDPTESPAPFAGANQCPEGFGCDICIGSTVDDPDKLVTIDLPGTGNTETATCGEWFAVGCAFVEGTLCLDYQTALAECCVGAPPVEPTPRPPTLAPATAPSEGGGNSCFDPAGCDVCGAENIVEDSKVVTIINPETEVSETATCGEWFLFGCGFIEPDVCEEYQEALTECCSGGAPTIMFTPAMTPSMFEPSMFTPSMMLTPSMLTPAMMPTTMAPVMETPTTETESPAPTGVTPASQTAPTSPTAPIVPEASAGASPRSFTQDASIDPFVVKFVGVFEMTEPNTFLIINTINGLIAPFLIGEIGDVLGDIDLDIIFKNATNSTGDRALRELQTTKTAWFQIAGKLELEGSSQEELDEWTPERVTEIVKSFFTGVELDKLFFTLSNNGLALDEIEMQDGSSDSIVTDEGTTTQSSGNESSTSESGGENKNTTAVVIASICGGFVFIVLAAAIYMNTRRQRKKFRSAREMRSIPDNDSLNLRSGQDDLPDSNGSATHVSFPHVLGDDEGEKDPTDLEYMDDDTLRAIKGKKKKHKKKQSRREELRSDNSWASISISSDTRGKRNKKRKSKNVAPANHGNEDDVYLSPVDI